MASRSRINKPAYAFSIAVLAVLAADLASAGFGVSGAILKAEVLPGEAISHQMTVRIAENDTPLDLVAEVVGFGQTLSGGCLTLKTEADTSPYSACDFLSVSPKSFSVEPGASQNLLLEGEIPLNVGAGGRYAIVEIQSLPAGDGPTGVTFAIDVPVFLTISGTELVETGEITDLQVEETKEVAVENVDDEEEKTTNRSNLCSSGRTLTVSLIFKNTGNHHYRAHAEAVLKDDDGTILTRGGTPRGEASIIPTASRIFEIPLETAANPTAKPLRLEAKVISEGGSTLASNEIPLHEDSLWRFL